MKSTPAVFCAPTMSALSTPHIATPAVFKNESYPWAVKTPEASPMCWDKEPSLGSCAEVSSLGMSGAQEPTISREFLRSVCEPFFEQMLDALQHALEQQQRQRQEEQAHAQGVAQCPSRLPMRHLELSRLPMRHLDPMPDEESTDIEEFGAFASLLSGPSSEDEKSSSALPRYSEASFAPIRLTKEESDPNSDPEKSAMVCRHWKTKGWCKMGSNCKFQHPEHKRGVALPKGGCGAGNAKCGDMIRAECPGIRTTLNLTQALGNQTRATAAVGKSQTIKKQSKVKLLEASNSVTNSGSEEVL
jgi:hypothetical protein